MIIGRRRASTIAIVLVSILAPLAAYIGARVLDGERITSYWTAAAISTDDPNAQVSEVIDYDFGQAARRGILRRVPDLVPTSEITVSSPTAPDQLQVGIGSGATLRIGDPDRTIRGRHRYFIDYTLFTLTSADRFSWNAVGTEWDVAISGTEIHVTSDREFSDVRCDRGRRGSFGGCRADQIEPGHLLIETGRLGTGEGITVSARLGPLLAAPPATPVKPSAESLSSGTPLSIVLIVSWVGTIAAVPIVGRVVSRRGREQIRNTTASTLGYIDDLSSLDSFMLADESEMARLIYPSLDPPRGISAPQGGILISESVRPEHKVAWLLEAAALGEVELEDQGGNKMVLRRGSTTPRPTSNQRIDSFFSKGDEVLLDEYDEDFANSWSDLEADLEKWKNRSGFWDAAGNRQRAAALVGGSFFVIMGLLGVALTSGFAMRWSPLWLGLVVLAGIVLGSALTVVVRSWELRVRTPEGTSKWIEVEALRRFLSELEPESALNMIEPDRFAGYTSWAIAFGLDDKWKEIVGTLRTDPRFRSVPPHHFRLAGLGSSVSAATRTASTAPSSSGGGGGGGVGGGGGGGGGGSW